MGDDEFYLDYNYPTVLMGRARMGVFNRIVRSVWLWDNYYSCGVMHIEEVYRGCNAMGCYIGVVENKRFR